MLRRTWIRLGACILAGSAALAGAQSTAEFPRQPIHVIVTFPPGGSTDAVIRILAPRLGDKLGQPVIIDNRPGAAGNIGLSLVAKAAPDGYTLGLGAAGALSANSSLYEHMPFDVQRDFKPVSLLAGIPFVLVGNPGVPAKSVKALIALAKSQPGRLSVGHGGNGTAMHLSTALFSQMAGVEIVPVPYKGSGPAALDALSGQVPLAMVDLPSALPQIRAGKLLAFAVTSQHRLPQLPDVPTLAESGLTGYESTGWFGVVAPAATPPAVIAQLNAAFTGALSEPDVVSALRNLGVEPSPDRPEEFGAYIASETAKWAKVIRQGNIRID